jgi:hypothetical protein
MGRAEGLIMPCKVNFFRMVARVPGNLKHVENKCDTG